MMEGTLLKELGQVGSGECGVIFREFIRGAVVSAFVDVISEEVDLLCGPSYGRSGSGAAYRAQCPRGLHSGRSQGAAGSSPREAQYGKG